MSGEQIIYLQNPEPGPGVSIIDTLAFNFQHFVYQLIYDIFMLLAKINAIVINGSDVEITITGWILFIFAVLIVLIVCIMLLRFLSNKIKIPKIKLK
jgi:hypothetical protein